MNQPMRHHRWTPFYAMSTWFLGDFHERRCKDCGETQSSDAEPGCEQCSVAHDRLGPDNSDDCECGCHECIPNCVGTALERTGDVLR